ncbi:hypothetical protein NC652_039090 [Populus alba x Populus x berolinensis]|nr:hypothetical protein NC652_039090 [Populus alba x Populus x berolinensis]
MQTSTQIMIFLRDRAENHGYVENSLPLSGQF